jgi:hypothetical protein
MGWALSRLQKLVSRLQKLVSRLAIARLLV